ncbi:AbrB/MazE/SpoVT family DNA-binding domain-containing protein [Natronomonas sp.]|jgi:bifunctional DNA-binding transcriptional regulator/antitoxin component of YhaV-PrlF toxin-antitoxin module|uniref:AbrB/MazE/SpoVT family DNA-binding domain-containing protein n=1 Tax=Natronomonas sp. TaxID=2184060 RepID=UPI00262D982F|nr:AbrB/MazE/SpoVT family DNA-binding domain-containing protein [Natronomonas sp.]
MVTETDDRGRIYLSKDLRERHGERFRVVDLPSRIVLVPVDDDPIRVIRESVGAAFEGTDIEDLREHARTTIAEETRREAGEGTDT